MFCTFENQKNNYLKENIILKKFDKQNNLKYCFVGNLSEIEIFLRKNENLLLSENILLSKLFLKDLIINKLENKEKLYL